MELCVSCENPFNLACAVLARYCNALCNAYSLQPCLVTVFGKKAATKFAVPPEKLPILFHSQREIENPLAIAKALASQNDGIKTLLLGKCPTEQAMVEQQINFVYSNISDCEIFPASFLNALNDYLKISTFVTSNSLTLPDILAFPIMHKFMSKSSAKERAVYSNITRWFNHMQNLRGIKNSVETLAFIDLEIDGAGFCPLGQAKVTTEKREMADDGKEKFGIREEGKEKNEKKKKDGKARDADSVCDRPVDDVTRLEVRVGLIQKVWRHPDADKLYCEEIDIGEAKPRIICSGLVPFLPPEGLLKKKVLVLANMKAKKLRGVESHGMLLCASDASHSKFEILEAPQNSAVGELVVWEGLSGQYDTEMSTKAGKYPFEKVQPFFKTDDNCVAYFKNHRFMTSSGPIRCSSVKGGSIS